MHTKWWAHEYMFCSQGLGEHDTQGSQFMLGAQALTKPLLYGLNIWADQIYCFRWDSRKAYVRFILHCSMKDIMYALVGSSLEVENSRQQPCTTHSVQACRLVWGIRRFNRLLAPSRPTGFTSPCWYHCGDPDPRFAVQIWNLGCGWLLTLTMETDATEALIFRHLAQYYDQKVEQRSSSEAPKKYYHHLIPQTVTCHE